MRRKDKNSLFKKYQATTNMPSDLKKEQVITIYRASGIRRLEYGPELFKFKYEPLFEYAKYQKLLNEYSNSKLVKELYELMLFNYATLYIKCYEWWFQNTLVTGAFIIDEEIEKYKAMKISDNCCPIIHNLDLNNLDNINFYRHFIVNIDNAELNDFKTVNEVLYGNTHPKIKSEYTSLALPLLNSVINITYKRFQSFLCTQKFNISNIQTKLKTDREISRRFIANEYALAYIFDLYANGKQIPLNETDGGFAKKTLIEIGFELYKIDNKKDTFYRAVKNVVKYDLNKKQDLLNISQNWIGAIKELTKDWEKTEKYLKEKQLLGE